MGDCTHFDGEKFCHFFNVSRTREFCENECEYNCGGESEDEIKVSCFDCEHWMGWSHEGKCIECSEQDSKFEPRE